MSIYLTSNLTFDLVNEFGLHNYLSIEVVDSTNLQVLTTYSDNSTSLGFNMITLDPDTLNFTGVLNFVNVISMIYNTSVANPNQFINYNGLLSSYTNTNASLLYTTYNGYLTNDNSVSFGLNNQTVQDVINYYSNLYYVGYANGGFVSYLNNLYIFAPDKYNRNLGHITLNNDLTFSGSGFMDLTYPYVTPFNSFIYDPSFQFTEIYIEFQTRNNEIYLFSGPGSGSISIQSD